MGVLLSKEWLCVYVFRGVLSERGVLIQSTSNAGGDKRGTRSSSWGGGWGVGLTPINSPSPSHFLPGVLGLCQECPRSHCPPGALFLVTHHQAFSAAHSATPPPVHPNTHTLAQTHPLGSVSSGPSLWIDHHGWIRQTGRRQDIRFSGPSRARWPSRENAASYFHLFGSLTPFLSYTRKRLKQWPECFPRLIIRSLSFQRNRCMLAGQRW